MIEANRRALVAPPPPRLQDWPETLAPTRAWSDRASGSGAFAATLESWPRLWEYARADDLGVLATTKTSARARASNRGPRTTATGQEER